MFEVKLQRDIVFDPRYPNECLLDIATPIVDQPSPLFVFFHGGGLSGGEHTLGPELIALSAQYGIAVVSAGYRLLPNAVFPDFIEDAAKALGYVYHDMQAKDSFSSVFVGGSSAGGYLSMMLDFAPSFLAAQSLSPDMIDGWIFDAGQPTTHYALLQSQSVDPRCVRIDERAPLYYLDESLQQKRTVPVLIIAASDDMPNRREENVVLYTAMKSLGYPEDRLRMIVMDGYTHTGYVGARRGEDQYVYADLIGEFIHANAK
ncbi:MAG: alpha/beta hydrolase [Clostridia bacterium]|nr:alpha/beta hydrolase [Clostridia bacterium]